MCVVYSCAAELEETRKKPSSSQRRELDQLRQENTSLQQRMRHQAVSTTSSHTSVSRYTLIILFCGSKFCERESEPPIRDPLR